jgi:hypothetical protein
MRIQIFLCTYQSGIVGSAPMTAEATDLSRHDIVQRTCALDVVVRSFAKRMHTLDLDVWDTTVPAPLEVPVSEPMLACKPAPAEEKDTTGTDTPSVLELDHKDSSSPALWDADGAVLACIPPAAQQSEASE